MSVEIENDLRSERWRGQPFRITIEHITAQIEEYEKRLPIYEECLESQKEIERLNGLTYWHMASERLRALIVLPKRDLLEVLEAIHRRSLAFGDKEDIGIIKELIETYQDFPFFKYIDLFTRAGNRWLEHLAEVATVYIDYSYSGKKYMVHEWNRSEATIRQFS